MTRRPDYLWLAFCVLMVLTALILLVTHEVPGEMRQEDPAWGR